MELEGIIAIAMAFFIVTVSPGPANIAVATVSMSSGRKNGLLFGLGLSVGRAFWGLVAATGMGAVLQSTTSALFVLKILGGLYLIWLAIQSTRSALQKSEEISRIARIARNGRWFWRGLILNISNPKAVVAWLAALSMGLSDGGNASTVIIGTSICIILGFVNYTGYALAFSLSGFMTAYKRLRRGIDSVVAGLFAIAGLSLIRSAFAR